MRTRSMFVFQLLVALCFVGNLWAQQNPVSTNASTAAMSSSPETVVPRLIKFTGTLLDEQARPMKSPVGVTFALYTRQSEGVALWMETQNVEVDTKGNYTVLLGANSANGVPADLFNTGEARWLSVQAERQPEQPRVLLVSVPYALKAGDAQTLRGLPPSAFAPANSARSNSVSLSSAPALTVLAPSLNAAPAPLAAISGTGITNFVPLWTPNGSTLGDSILFQSTATNVNVNGSFSLPATGMATATGGANSQPLDFLASAFDSAPFPGAAVPQHFRWQAEPVGNDTTTPSGKLNLLFGAGTATPAETGFSISSKGLLSFASGQTFPGVPELGASNTFVGNETVTGSVTATTSSTTANGVEGDVSATSGTAAGVYGLSSSSSGYGVEGTSVNVGVFGNGSNIGVKGAGNSFGVQGTAAFPGGVGVLGTGTTGLEGKGSVGVQGIATFGGLSGLFQSGPVKVAGNGNNLLAGDPGCGSGFAGIAVTTGSFTGCTNYALIGGPKGDTAINSSGTASIHFRSNNNELATIDNSGNIHVIGQNGGGNLTVAGTVHSGGNLTVAGTVHSSNPVGVATASGMANASKNGCTLPTTTMPNSACVTPGMTVTLTTTGGPVLIEANIGGVWTNSDSCNQAMFFLVIDSQIVSTHAAYAVPGSGALQILTTENLVSWQTPAAGKHTFQVQEADFWSPLCGSFFPSQVGNDFYVGTPPITRTLIVREF